MQIASANLSTPIEHAGFLKEKIPRTKGGHTMMKFNLFALTFTISIRHPQSAKERYEDRKRIDALRNKMLDKRFEFQRNIR